MHGVEMHKDGKGASWETVDEEDWPVPATASALNCAVWTEDSDFFGTGIAAWTTNRIEIFLKTHRNPSNQKKYSCLPSGLHQLKQTTHLKGIAADPKN